MSNNATPWGGVIKIDKAPADGDLLVGSANGSFSLSSEISGDSLAPGSVTTSKIANGAVTTDKIPNDAITTAKLIDQGVVAAKLANGSVTAPKMPDGVITTTKIADGAITTGKIQANAITANLIASEAIVTDKLAAGCIVTEKIQANAITAVTIKAKSIETEKIQIGAVVTDSIANYNVSNTAYIQGSNTSSGSPITTSTVSLVKDARVSIMATYAGGDNLGITATTGTLTALVNGSSFTNNTITIRPAGSGVGFTTYPGLIDLSGNTTNFLTSVAQAYVSVPVTLLTFYQAPSTGDYTFSAYASSGFSKLVSLLVMELKR